MVISRTASHSQSNSIDRCSSGYSAVTDVDLKFGDTQFLLCDSDADITASA